MQLQIDIELLKSSFQIKCEGELVTNWGINHFPDGQLQFWIGAHEKLWSVGGSLTASISNPAELDVFNQMIEVLYLADITVLYCYGARCDKAYTDKVYLAPVAYLFLIPLTYRKFSQIPVTVLSPHCHTFKTAPSLNFKMNFFIPKEVLEKDYDTWIYPDQSAFERFGSQQPENVRGIFCKKTREQSTGQIIEHTIDWPENYIANKILVIDDLCDGGRTFLDIAQMMYNDKNVGWAGAGALLDLYVTHGVFSGNVSHVMNQYNNVYVTNSLRSVDTVAQYYPNLHVTNVW